MAVVVTHPDRVVFPETGHTKGAVCAYYERMAPRILPHVAGRALTLRRFPRGVGAPGFFQKNVPPHYPPSIERFTVPRRDGETVFPVVREAEHLVFLANQGVIELHVPTDRVDQPFHPDRFVIDLDPPEGAFALVRCAAERVVERLGAWGLPTVLVATGSKGYHVVAPIVRGVESHELAEAGQKIGLLLEQADPDTFTNAFKVAKRGGKVFVDWMRNFPMATVVAPFSLRARARPTVAAPIRPAELGAVAPDAFDLDSVPAADPLAAAPAADPAPFLAAVEEAFAASGLPLAPFDRFRS